MKEATFIISPFPVALKPTHSIHSHKERYLLLFLYCEHAEEIFETMTNAPLDFFMLEYENMQECGFF